MKKFNKALLCGISSAFLVFAMSSSAFASVSIKVTGDSVHGKGEHTAYEEWLNVQSDTAAGQTADKVVLGALSDAGYAYDWNNDWGGYLVSVTTPDGATLGSYTNGPKSGWMYFVNGAETGTGLAGYTVQDNDSIELNYYDNYGEVYGTFGLNVNSNVEDVKVEVSVASGSAIEEDAWGGWSLAPGVYNYTASKDGYIPAGGSFVIKNDDADINVELVEENHCLVKINGDSVHDPGAHTAYVPWINSQTEFKHGQTAYDAVSAALTAAGYTLNWNSEWNYLSSVTTPDGVTLGEFTNGPKSGWMYFVNGVDTGTGLADCIVQAGDIIELNYYDNYGEVYGFALTINSDTENYTINIYNSGGEEMFDFGWGYSLPSGVYTYTAKSGALTASGSFEVLNDDAEITLTFEQTFIWGDFDLNGTLDAADAAAILQKALISTFPSALEDITYIDVDKNGEITANDSAVVLSKVLNGSFVMPCEEIS